MSEWVKCSDQMPEDYADVLLTDGTEVHVGWCYTTDDSKYRFDSWGEKFWFFDYEEISHWMPLPEPPEDN